MEFPALLASTGKLGVLKAIPAFAHKGQTGMVTHALYAKQDMSGTVS
jgi:hypothetical protein